LIKQSGKQSDITIDEIIEKLNLYVTNETVRKAVIKMGYVYKKKSLYASERERPDVRDKRKNWVENLPGYAEEKSLYFLMKAA